MSEAAVRNRLREWRKLRGLTLMQVANSDGINLTIGHIGNLERGTRELTKPVMERLSRLFDCHEADLLLQEDGGLSVEERRIIDIYRSASEDGRRAIRAVAESQRT